MGANGSKNYFIKKAYQPQENLVVFQIIENNDLKTKNMKNTLSPKMTLKSS